MSDVNITITKELLGHADLNTTHGYVEINMKMKESALAKTIKPQNIGLISSILKQEKDVIKCSKLCEKYEGGTMGIAEEAAEEAYMIVNNFWKCMVEQKWDQMPILLDRNFEASWPQSREVMNVAGFIEVNKNYPGSHEIKVGNMNHEYDSWEHSSLVITQTSIKSKMLDGKLTELYAISFFKIMHDEDGEKKITELIEYWADTYPPPQWRSQWVKISDKRIM